MAWPGYVRTEKHRKRSAEILEECRRLGKLDSRILEPGLAAKKYIYSVYQRNARNRDLNFELSIAEFVAMAEKNCTYCGTKPLNSAKGNAVKKRFNGDWFHNGIDRIDSSVGYELNNCVPCCKYCNWAKRDRSVDEFRDWLSRAFNYFIGG